MTRKQFLLVVIALLVLGGAGLWLFRQDIAAYRASGAKIGAPLLPSFKLAEVAQVTLKDAKSQATLVRRETGWVVRERGDYPANFQDISDLLVKLAELKVTQSDPIGESLLPRVDLVEPGKSKGEGEGILVEFTDSQQKPLAKLVLGRVVKKKDPLNPLPSAVDGVPAGRYVKVVGAGEQVVVVSDPLSKADAKPGKWLAKDFFKAERIRALTVGPEGGMGWKIAREEEWGQWRFASGGGDLSASAAVSAVNALANMSFEDVALDASSADTERPVVAVAETFDNLTYTVRIAKRKSAAEFLVSVNVTGEPPKTRVPEKGEKAEQKERRDKDFAESLKRLEERIARERALAKWTYVVGAKELEPLMRERADLIAKPRPKDEKGGPPRLPF